MFDESNPTRTVIYTRVNTSLDIIGKVLNIECIRMARRVISALWQKVMFMAVRYSADITREFS
jgi:hypothetical protein